MIVFNTPNVVTLSRIVLIPLIIAIFYVPDDWLSFSGKNIAATAIFIFAAVTRSEERRVGKECRL